MSDVTDLPLIASAASAQAVLPGRAGWLTTLRAAGLEQFRGDGLPTRRVEDWRYTATALKTMSKTAFTLAALAEDVVLAAIPADRALDVAGAHKIVFVNGRYAPELSDLTAAPAGLTVTSLAKVLESDPASVEGHLGRLQALEGFPFAALATGFLNDGVVIQVAGAAVVETPVHVISIAAAGEGQALAFTPRLLIQAAAGSTATVIESHIGASATAQTFTNAVTEVTVAEGATLNHYKLQNEEDAATHIAALSVEVAARGTYEGFQLSFGGAVARNDIRLLFTGEEATAQVNGAYGAASGQHMDTTSRIIHAVPSCASGQVYKGVLDGTGRGVFQGRIDVERAAQHTDGQQLHKALLLSRGAEVDIKPELRIYADDVKCSHGATAGELDDNALFYLRSRGLDAETARGLLIEGFLDDVIDKVAVEAVKEAMAAHVHAWLNRRIQAAKEA